jgi:hypothetical protein
MSIKFFMRDVIGAKPKKVGDVFKARFMGSVEKFVVTEISGDMIFTEM